jgi:hypothetical protein
MAKRTFPITRKQFSQIIRKRGFTAKYGDGTTCPVAMAIKAVDKDKKYESLYIGGNGRWYPTGIESLNSEELPGWVTRFVAKYDVSQGTVKDAQRIQPKIV